MNEHVTLPNLLDSIAYSSLHLGEGEWRIRFLREHGIPIEAPAEYYAAISDDTWEKIKFFFDLIGLNKEVA
ncbi:hypothetical protein ACP4J5_17385 [Pseudomonas oryzihabitans]|uniref:hypothetical protein n=1 Tax=Pseudomonas oryzihabitans TaxID=47885 RepID=UPI003CE78C3C